MLDFPRWKVWMTILTIVIVSLFSIPSLLPENARTVLPSWVPAPTINLGLDLAGGSYILLEAKTDAVAQRRLEAMRETVVNAARQSPRIVIGDISLRDGQVSFLVDDGSKVDAVRQRLLDAGVGGSGVGLTGQQEWNVEVRDSTRFVLTQTQAGLTQAIDRAMSDAREIVDKRINGLGTLEPTIVRQGSNRIVVQVPGLQDPSALVKLIGTTANLEFKMVDDNATPDELANNQPPVGSVILPYAEGGGSIALLRSTLITGDMLSDASQGFNPQNPSQPIVNMTFNAEGGRRFARATQSNVGKRFAIVVDDVVISAPRINTEILGGRAYIEGNFTVDSANQLAIALKSGKLPVPLAVVEESTISPELGKDSIDKGIIAATIATVLVIALMLFTYFRFGVYATIALVVNILMILGIMAIFNATLTLPGIAGFVLTIGAAVDANVLINERIREEQRRGRTVMQSVEVGYKEASRAIFDANLTNVIAAAIMFIFGSGPVRGFAVVLTIGIVTSVFTAVTFTRLMAAQWLQKRPKQLVI